MKLSRRLRAGQLVGNGPSGSPPPGLRGFEIYDGIALPPANLRPEGSRVIERAGGQAFDRMAGQWRNLAALGALFGATSDLGNLIAMGSDPNFSQLMSMSVAELGYITRTSASPKEAGRVLRLSVGSLLTSARADQMSTARGVVGVSLNAAAAGDPIRVQRVGVARVAAAAGCAPAVNAPAYLSAVTEGTVYHAISGATYPRIVGRFLEAVVAADGTVAVMLDIDEDRDDAADWVLSDTVLVANAGSVTVPVTRGLFRALELEACNVGLPAGAGAVSYECDSSHGIYSWNGGVTANASALYWWPPERNTTIRISDHWTRSGTRWAGEAWTWGVWSDNAWKVGSFRAEAPADTMRVFELGGQLIFRVDSRIVMRGKVRTP